MRLKISLLLANLCVTLMACTLIGNNPPIATPTGQPNITAPAHPGIDARLQAALPALKAVNIPLHLPPSIDDFPKQPQDVLYVTVLKAETNSYDLAITLQANCPAHACTQGHLTGEAGVANPPQGTSVALTNNITGYYAPPVCGANCSDGQLSWNENNNRYSVTMRGDNVGILTKVANAILATDPVTIPK